MPVHQPSFVLLATALVLALVVSTGLSGAERSVDAQTVTIPSEFPLSGSAQAFCTGDKNAALTGSVQLVSTGRSSYLFIPATDAVNGARLTSLQDSETGIVFRNNTITLPVKASSGKTAGLVLATEAMMADRGGYLGRITGSGLEMPAEMITVGGKDFSANVTVFLRDLTEGLSYMISAKKGDEMAGKIDLALLPSGLVSLDVPIVIETDGADQGSRSAIEFVIVSMSADAAWAKNYGSNVTIFERKNQSAAPLSCRMQKIGDDRVVYEAVVAGPGTFALAAAGEKRHGGIVASLASLGDILAFGGLLAILVSVLVIMLRRVAGK